MATEDGLTMTLLPGVRRRTSGFNGDTCALGRS
jgi:hypothetical protein